MTTNDGRSVRLTVDNWIGIIVIALTVVGSTVHQTTKIAKLETTVDYLESRISKVEDLLTSRPD